MRKIILRNYTQMGLNLNLFPSRPAPYAEQLRFKSSSPFTMIRNYMTEAIQILNTVQDFIFPGRHEYLHPYTVLKALLTHAPSETAKQDIARNIIEITAEGDIVAGLTDLTDYWWTTFLVPRKFLYPLQYLLMKSAERRRKIPTSFRPSIPP
jgi:hypothetical protein